MSAPSTADESPWNPSTIAPRVRLIIDNDFAGDPDGLVQLAQHLLSPDCDLRLVVGSHFRSVGNLDPEACSAGRSVEAARRVAELCGRTDVVIVPGANRGLDSHDTAIPSPAAEAIVAEAMRDDTDVPLFVACGAGLTEIANAWLMEPSIAERVTIVWIGGSEHEGLADEVRDEQEYNLSIDRIAAQVVFNRSAMAIWQVPRDQYRTTLASRAEMVVRMRPHGPLGLHLFESLADIFERAAGFGLRFGDTFILGDSPLVLLTALQSSFDRAPSSSRYTAMACPWIDDDGHYVPNPDGRPIRVYTLLDNRLLLEDLYAKLELHAAASS
ncbi:MAG: nucleoside hydrolase [Actinomycetota bacterium]|nr:nucleoside hydrolase [Actinomycetota bacterium]